MTASRRDDDAWFAPKRYGFGAGLPIAWQGWVTLAIYSAIVILTGGALVPRHPVPAVVIILAATAAFLVICAHHTRGGWRWRWGGED
ncbi:hypothetical protein [Sphingomonas sp. DT-204]|uniref:hypothetical protein n=1 Tax=Sphingomonas sp. DT-204 TaxID=3396166 RepID=UPI003F1B8793